jgi:acetyl esterase/lipase
MSDLSPRDRIRAALPEPEATLESEFSIPQQRAAWEQHMMLGLAVPPGVTVVDVRQPVPGVMVTPADIPGAPLILYAHGGGFVMGSPKTHLGLAIRLARESGARVLLVDYRLAPEHPFPAARDDFIAAYRAAIAHGHSPQRIVVAGDSAGAHVVMSSLLALHEAEVEPPAALVLISPWLDLAQRGDSMWSRAAADPLILRRDLDDCAGLYLRDHSALSPGIDVLGADMRIFPPLLVHVGEDEVLLSDSVRLAEGVDRVGGRAQLKVWPGLWHVFHAWAPQLPEATDAIAQIGRFIADQFSLASGTR